jgi:hypothetical protein
MILNKELNIKKPNLTYNFHERRRKLRAYKRKTGEKRAWNYTEEVCLRFLTAQNCLPNGIRVDRYTGEVFILEPYGQEQWRQFQSELESHRAGVNWNIIKTKEHYEIVLVPRRMAWVTKWRYDEVIIGSAELQRFGRYRIVNDKTELFSTYFINKLYNARPYLHWAIVRGIYIVRCIGIFGWILYNYPSTDLRECWHFIKILPRVTFGNTYFLFENLWWNRGIYVRWLIFIWIPLVLVFFHSLIVYKFGFGQQDLDMHYEDARVKQSILIYREEIMGSVRITKHAHEQNEYLEKECERAFGPGQALGRNRIRRGSVRKIWPRGFTFALIVLVSSFFFMCKAAEEQSIYIFHISLVVAICSIGIIVCTLFVNSYISWPTNDLRLTKIKYLKSVFFIVFIRCGRCLGWILVLQLYIEFVYGVLGTMWCEIKLNLDIVSHVYRKKSTHEFKWYTETYIPVKKYTEREYQYYIGEDKSIFNNIVNDIITKGKVKVSGRAVRRRSTIGVTSLLDKRTAKYKNNFRDDYMQLKSHMILRKHARQRGVLRGAEISQIRRFQIENPNIKLRDKKKFAYRRVRRFCSWYELRFTNKNRW